MSIAWASGQQVRVCWRSHSAVPRRGRTRAASQGAAGTGLTGAKRGSRMRWILLAHRQDACARPRRRGQSGRCRLGIKTEVAAEEGADIAAHRLTAVQAFVEELEVRTLEGRGGRDRPKSGPLRAAPQAAADIRQHVSPCTRPPVRPPAPPSAQAGRGQERVRSGAGPLDAVDGALRLDAARMSGRIRKSVWRTDSFRKRTASTWRAREG
jgi:hypothetical protein